MKITLKHATSLSDSIPDSQVPPDVKIISRLLSTLSFIYVLPEGRFLSLQTNLSKIKLSYFIGIPSIQCVHSYVTLFMATSTNQQPSLSFTVSLAARPLTHNPLIGSFSAGRLGRVWTQIKDYAVDLRLLLS